MIGSPVMLRKFDSGVMVIQNKSHSDEEVLLKSHILMFHYLIVSALIPVLIFLAADVS